MTKEHAEQLAKENQKLIGKRVNLPNWKEPKKIISVYHHEIKTGWEVLVEFPAEGVTIPLSNKTIIYRLSLDQALNSLIDKLDS